MVPPLIRHAGGGRHPGREGMDTGFRRYDASRPDRTCIGIFEGNTNATKLLKCFLSLVLLVPSRCKSMFA
jgi:hypothetical protein